MVSITIENAVKVLGQVRAVDGVSLGIEKGELFFLLGPSGCGKTTRLRAIAGFSPLESGRILFDDRDVNDLRGSLVIDSTPAVDQSLATYDPNRGLRN